MNAFSVGGLGLGLGGVGIFIFSISYAIQLIVRLPETTRYDKIIQIERLIQDLGMIYTEIEHGVPWDKNRYMNLVVNVTCYVGAKRLNGCMIEETELNNSSRTVRANIRAMQFLLADHIHSM
jgi:hypothetical protein